MEKFIKVYDLNNNLLYEGEDRRKKDRRSLENIDYRYSGMADRRKEERRNKNVKVYDNINPSYYDNRKIKAIDCVKSLLEGVNNGFEGFLKGNLYKYVCREQFKGGKEDLEKAKWFLDKIITEKYND